MAANLACACRWHHRAKTDGVWRVRMDPDGTQHWTGPHSQALHSVPTGMPPTPTGPPEGGTKAGRSGTAPPVLRRPAPAPAEPAPPPDDLPPDDLPPPRWTPDGHWAHDPLSVRDLDDVLDTLLGDINRWDRAQRVAALTGANTRNTTPARPPPPDDPGEPPPF